MRKKLRKKFLKVFGGKKRYQPFFQKLLELSMAGLNLGGGENISYSGERGLIASLASNLAGKKYIVIFDIGANCGDYTLELVSVFGDKASIYSFEPLKEAYAKLAKNAEPHANIRTYNFGFGEKAATLRIYSDGSSSTLASLFRRRMSHLGVDAAHSEDVSIKRLDDFCREKGIGHVDFMKIDVEGSEFDVLKGAGKLLEADSIDMVQFEFGGFNISSRTFFQDFFYLLEPYFRIYRILKDGVAEVTSYRESQEIFLTTNYLAVSRKLNGYKF